MEQALAYRPFADALQGNTLNLGPMTREELRRAIERPAEKLNITFETGLVERILDDIENEPGNLPLLEFALTLLWDRQTTGKLTHEAYEAIGQVKGALARHADEVYADLSQNEQQQLRRVLVQLVRPGEGTEDTRRLANRKELNEDQWILVRRIADARLVVTDRDPAGEETVEVVHESLIRSWGKLREWMQADRGFRTWQERLRAALRQWEASERDDGALLRGVPLAEAEEWLAEREIDLSQTERQFIRNSLALQEQEQAEKEAQHRRELEAAQKLAKAEEKARQEAEQRVQEQTRATKRLRWLVVGLALVFLITVGIALFAIQERNKAQHAEHIAEQERDKARNAETEAKQQAIIAKQQKEKAKKQTVEAERQARIAQARRLAVEAQAVLEEFPQRSLLLAVEALNVTLRESEPRILAAEQVLRDALAKTGGIVLSGGAIAISPDGHWLATGNEDGTARVWDLTIPDPAAATIVLRGHEGGISTVAFSPDAHWLATGSWGDATARLWDLTAPDPTATSMVLRGHGEDITTVAFSPDTHWLVTGNFNYNEDGTARLWDLTVPDPAASPLVFRGHKQAISTVVFSQDTHWLVTSTWISARLWDLTAPDPAASPLVHRDHERYISTVAFSPDNHWLATGSFDYDGDATVRLWNLTVKDPAASPLVFRGHEDDITTVAFSPDTHWLVTGSRDGTARLWDLTALDPAASPLIFRGHEGIISHVAFSPDTHWLVTGSGVHLTFTPTGERLTAGSGDQTARLWTLRLDELIEFACFTAGRNLSYTEWDQYFRGEDYRKTCPDLPIHPGMIITARNSAKAGDIDGAIAIFQKALELDSSLDFDPKTEAQKWAAKGLIEKGKQLAKEGKVKEAITAYEEAKALDPILNLNPKIEAGKWVAPTLIEKGEQLAEEGKVQEAIAAYEEAQTFDPTLEISAESWNTLCWDGSLWEYAAEVMNACEKAVILAPEDGDIRDSRGLARALTGNIEGAIEDFQAFVYRTDNKEEKAQRQRWIEVLRAGENPFTPEELEKLREGPRRRRRDEVPPPPPPAKVEKTEPPPPTEDQEEPAF